MGEVKAHLIREQVVSHYGRRGGINLKQLSVGAATIPGGLSDIAFSRCF